VARLIAIVMDEMDGRVPHIARQVLKVIVSQIEDIQTRIAGLEAQILAWHKSNPVSQRLAPSRGSGRMPPAMAGVKHPERGHVVPSPECSDPY
jgi:transposase